MEDCKSCLFLKKELQSTVWEGDRNYLWSKLVNKISFTFSHPLFPLGFSYNKKDNDLLERKKRTIFLEAEFKSIWQKKKGKTLAGSDIVKKLRTNTFQNASPWRNDADKFFSSEIEFMLKVLCCKHFDNIIKSGANINKNIRFTSDAVSN